VCSGNSKDAETEARTYQLFIRLDSDCDLTIGKLGRFIFPAGIYVYTGSARRNLAQRLARHQRRDKKKRWHIDYLLDSPHAKIVNTLTFSEDECVINQRESGEVVVKGFGASDCRMNCGAHLKKIML
jgi:Uri superfamily endonuclease